MQSAREFARAPGAKTKARRNRGKNLDRSPTERPDGKVWSNRASQPEVQRCLFRSTVAEERRREWEAARRPFDLHDSLKGSIFEPLQQAQRGVSLRGPSVICPASGWMGEVNQLTRRLPSGRQWKR